MSLALAYLRLVKLLRAAVTPRFRRAIVRHGVAAASEHRTVLRGNWATVVDIGANKGQFSLAVREWTEARIYAFEPLSRPANIFRKIFQDDQRVTLFPYAIGPAASDQLMHVSGKEDSSSLLEIGSEQSRLFPGTAEVSQQVVSVRRLIDALTAEMIAAPALLKLDVQGYEHEALSGCAELLARFDVVYCECSFIELYTGQRLAAEVVELLARYDFVISGVHNPTYDSQGRCVQADLLFSNTKIRRLRPFEFSAQGA